MSYVKKHNTLQPTFQLLLDGVDVEIIRNNHLRSSRGNFDLCKDAWMSKKKYKRVLEKGLKNVEPIDFTLTWTSLNCSFAIAGSKKSDDRIIIFGAIMKSKNTPESLYKLKGSNRYHLGDIDFRKEEK